MNKYLQDLLISLNYKLVHIYRSGEVELTQKIFVIDNFQYPSMSNPIDHIELKGRDITELFINSEKLNRNVNEKSVLEEKLNLLKSEEVKFSKDYSWEWYS